MRMRLRERRSSMAQGISLLSSWQSRAKPIIGRPETSRFGETNLCRRSRDSALRLPAHTDYFKYESNPLKNRFDTNADRDDSGRISRLALCHIIPRKSRSCPRGVRQKKYKSTI